MSSPINSLLEREAARLQNKLDLQQKRIKDTQKLLNEVLAIIAKQ